MTARMSFRARFQKQEDRQLVTADAIVKRPTALRRVAVIPSYRQGRLGRLVTDANEPAPMGHPKAAAVVVTASPPGEVREREIVRVVLSRQTINDPSVRYFNVTVSVGIAPARVSAAGVHTPHTFNRTPDTRSRPPPRRDGQTERPGRRFRFRGSLCGKL